jgi:hypothetical protein
MEDGMIWLLSAIAFDEIATLVIGIVLSLTISSPLMPRLLRQPAAVLYTVSYSLHHPVVTFRLAASHWDHHA